MNDSPVEGCESAVESPPGATAARCVEQATADAISKKRIKVRMGSLLLRLIRGFKLKPRAPWGSMSNCRLEAPTSEYKTEAWLVGSRRRSSGINCAISVEACPRPRSLDSVKTLATEWVDPGLP